MEMMGVSVKACGGSGMYVLSFHSAKDAHVSPLYTALIFFINAYVMGKVRLNAVRGVEVSVIFFFVFFLSFFF